MPPKRRDRADPFEDAKDAINNTTSMNEGDRYQLFASSLLQLPKSQACSLTKLCVDVEWKTGITLAISALSADDISQNSFLDYVVSRPNVDEKTKVENLTLFLLRNCSVNQTRPVEEGDAREYYVYAAKTSHEIIWRNEGVSPSISKCVIHFVQTVVNQQLPSVMSLILPKLSRNAYRLALAESIASNSEECYQVLISKKAELDRHDLEAFAVYLAAQFGRTQLLSKMFKSVSKTTLDTLKTQGMNTSGSFVSLKSTTKQRLVPKYQQVWNQARHVYETVFLRNDTVTDTVPATRSESIFERTAHSNHPDCLKLLIEQKITSSYNSYDELLERCSRSNFSTPCSILLLDACKFSSSTLVDTLGTLLENGSNEELCLAVIEKLRVSKEKHVRDFLRSSFSLCFKNCWNDGLFTLASKALKNLSSDPEVKKNAEETLNALVLRDDRRCNNIIKHLIIAVGFDMVPYFKHVVLRTENAELVQFFLAFKNKKLFDAAQQLKSQVKNGEIKKLLEGAQLNEVKMKIEAKEQSPAGKKGNKKKK